MRFFLTCLQCQEELGHPSFEPIFEESFDDRIIQFTCSRGHDCHTLIQSQKFELLLDSGAAALSSGFTLEAVGAYAAALERFFEFSTEVICAHQGITHETYLKMFSQMAVQSERQIGAFMMSYALLTSNAFVLNGGIPKFRNKVIHRGYIPSKEEAINYCSSVYLEILNTVRTLKELCPAAIDEVVKRDLKERHTKLPKTCRASTYAGGGILSLVHESHKDSFLESYNSYIEWLKSLEKSAPAMNLLFKTINKLL